MHFMTIQFATWAETYWFCVEYLVDRFEIESLGCVHITRQLMNAGLIRWLVKRCYLDKFKIIYKYKPSYSHSADTFKKATIKLRQLCPDTYKGPIKNLLVYLVVNTIWRHHRLCVPLLKRHLVSPQNEMYHLHMLESAL